jgi:hypothetical protein
MTGRMRDILESNLRRQIVDAVYSAFTSAAGKPLIGDVLYELANDEAAHGFDDQDHFVRLVRECVLKGLLTEQPGEVRRKGEAFGLRHVRYAITARGAEVATESGKAEPGVWDGRMSGEGVE